MTHNGNMITVGIIAIGKRYVVHNIMAGRVVRDSRKIILMTDGIPFLSTTILAL